MTEHLSTILRKTQSVLGPGGEYWGQGSFWMPNGHAKVCLLGALACAGTGVHPDDAPTVASDWWTMEYGDEHEFLTERDMVADWVNHVLAYDHITTVRRILEEMVDENLHGEVSVAWWNDTEDRTFDEVRDVLVKAVAVAEALENAESEGAPK